jgi:hypothetical protein
MCMLLVTCIDDNMHWSYSHGRFLQEDSNWKQSASRGSSLLPSCVHMHTA